MAPDPAATSNAPPPPPAPPHRYTAELAGTIETRWQAYWEEHRTFHTPNPGPHAAKDNFDPSRPRFYCLDMFPYPSGAGLHVGHPEGYTATDIVSRYMRMKGYNVLHPMGWDAFGLPAEQYAVQTGIHPAITTRSAIDTFRRQLKRFGFSYDWSRELATIDPDYYKWTQWIFLRIYNSWYDHEKQRARPIADLIAELESGSIAIDFEGDLVHLEGREGGNIPGITGQSVGLRMWHQLSQEERRAFIDNQRLAYISEQTVNWCPKLGTVLANEEVIDGRSERGGYPVYRKSLKQWMLRITAYAERLLNDLQGLDWPESTRAMQTDWIGRSEGAEIDFELIDGPQGEFELIRVYTTRPDTIFGATYMAIAPEHPLVQAILDAPPPGADVSAIRAYVDEARNKGDVERQAEGKDKTGIFSGILAKNPASGAEVPVWIADYVLMGYGHGAIMAVPAHDQRDFDFARRFDLPIRDVVYPRALAAMHYFAMHAPAKSTDTAAEDDAWKHTLAEFLSIVTTGSIPPREFETALARAREADDRDAARHEIDPAVRERELPGEIRQQSVTRMTWLEAIDALGFTTFAHMRARFESAEFQKHTGEAYEGAGFNVNSSNDQVSLDGLPTHEAKETITQWLDSQSIGQRKINYRLRDWLFSRQRYWGEPFPLVWDGKGNHYPVSEGALPVRLPEMENFRPPESEDPVPMLAAAPREWRITTAGEAGVDPSFLPPETPVQREANTMPNWAGSCWYYLRYCDPQNPGRIVGVDAERYWMGEHGVDLYIGGAEHAVLHLLYARFWHKVLYDLGYVTSPEPMRKLFHQGLITSFAYRDATGRTVPVDEVEERNGLHYLKGTNEQVHQIVAKMSKTLKNVVNPDDVIAEYGADTFRLYEMYMGPLESSKPWNPRDITGIFRFLQRAWRLVVDEQTGTLRAAESRNPDIERELHRMISRVGPGIEKLTFNTAIAAMIEFVNAATSANSGASTGAAPTSPGVLTRDQIDRFALVLAPFAPHLAEELWSKLGHAESLACEPWPEYDESLLRQAGVEIPVQINGKVRSRITVATDAPQADIEATALADERVREFVEGRAIARIIVIPGKMVNIVAK